MEGEVDFPGVFFSYPVIREVNREEPLQLGE